MRTVRFGVVGCGYFGGELARIVHRLDQSEVAAVHGGSRAPSLAEELQCDWERNLEDLVKRDDLDAIIVATPSHVHREPTLLAAKYGKHVFCEKPVALSLQDCDEMIEACRQANVLFMAGHIYHFMNGVKQVQQWISEGAIGKPLVAHAERTGWEHRQKEVSWKKNNETSGGHLFHHIHEIDLLQSIMGPALEVCTAGGNLAHQGEGYGNEEDVLLVTLKFPGDAVGSMQYGSGFRWGGHVVRINGTEGAVVLDMEKSKVYLKKDGVVTEHLLNYSEEEDEERAQYYRVEDRGAAYGTKNSKHLQFAVHMMELEMAAFRDAVLGKPIEERLQPLFDGSAARTSIATAEAALKSLREKRWMKI